MAGRGGGGAAAAAGNEGRVRAEGRAALRGRERRGRERMIHAGATKRKGKRIKLTIAKITSFQMTVCCDKQIVRLQV